MRVWMSPANATSSYLELPAIDPCRELLLVPNLEMQPCLNSEPVCLTFFLEKVWLRESRPIVSIDLRLFANFHYSTCSLSFGH